MAGSSSWYDDSTLVRGLQQALIDAEVLTETDDFAEFSKHPQRFNEHYEAWESNNYPDTDHPNWDSFVNDLPDDEDSDDEDEDNGTE